MQTVLFVVLDGYADWEGAPLAAALRGELEGVGQYDVKTVSLTREPIKSMGGFTVLPDYAIDEAPEDYAALILIGGTSWRKDESQRVMNLLEKAMAREVVVGAICDATVFLSKNGLLNTIEHTGNFLENVKEIGGSNYSNEAGYLEQQAVRSGRIITANGTAYLEFGKEVLKALDAAPQDKIDEWYGFFKQGFHEYMKTQN